MCGDEETQAQGGTVIAPDTFDDGDSAIAVSVSTSTTSLRSSVMAYQEENGRRYHALSAGQYILPNDELELDRLELQHTLFLLTLDNELCLSPKSKGAKRVLDVGTGTGVWAMDYADMFPEAEVIGVDLSPVQPTLTPPNCKFEVDDVEKEWLWQPFDFIFSRMLVGSFADPQAFVQKAFDNLEPGGYLEMQDTVLPVASDDGTLKPDSYLIRMCEMSIRAGHALGRDLNYSERFEEMFTKAGFVDVTIRRFKWPSNVWPRDKKFKDMGRWNFACMDGGLEGLSMALFTRGLGLSKEETLAFCAGARKEIRDVNIHAYWPIAVCYGRKPEKEE